MSIPEAETLSLSDGTTVTVSKMPYMTAEEWKEMKKSLEEDPEEARRVEAFSGDFKAVKSWMQSQAITEYYQAKLGAGDETITGKLMGLDKQPEFAHIYEDVKRGGMPAAQQHSYNEPLMMKVNRAVGGIPEEVKDTLAKIHSSSITLQEACVKGDLKAVEESIKAGSGKALDKKDSKGITCLAYAVGANRISVVKLLLAEKADPAACDSTQAMALYPHQFSGGGPPVLVRNTFLDIDDRPPTPPALQRAKTAPPPRSTGLIKDDDEETSSEEEDEEEDDDRSPAEYRASEEQPVTRDCYERREDWKWVDSTPPTLVDSAPSSPLGNASTLGSEVTMLPVTMSPAGPDRGADAQAVGAGAGSIEVSSAILPAPGGGAGGQPGAEDDAQGVLVAPQPQTLTAGFSIKSGYYRVLWTVDARKLRGNDKQAVSPPFELSFGNQFPNVTFKMMIYPKVMNDSKGGASFKKARGRGFVQLKCEAELAEAIANVKFRISIGSGENKQVPRGPKSHNFSSSAVCGLDKEEEEWDFTTVVDQESMTFVVCLEIVPHSCTPRLAVGVAVSQ